MKPRLRREGAAELRSGLQNGSPIGWLDEPKSDARGHETPSLSDEKRDTVTGWE